MLFLAIDLGSTNTKAALYDERMRRLSTQSVPLTYLRADGFVEFDPNAYLNDLLDLIRSLFASGGADPRELVSITLTGQAESLLVLESSGQPLMNAISWMDERSQAECAELETAFSGETCYAHTGQPAALPTWPATKILWLRKHRPEVFSAAAHYVLLKDYIVYRLTGSLAADCSIATFSFYFDIYERRYWPEMLAYLGVREAQLSPLAEPCEPAGTLLPELAATLGLPTNVGQLPSGEEITQYTITNASGACCTLLDYGATWRSMFVPNRNGVMTDVVLGFDTLEEYQRQEHH